MCFYTDASTEMKKKTKAWILLSWSRLAGQLSGQLEQFSISLFHWMSIHEEINHTRHDNTAQKQPKRACLLCGWILIHQEMVQTRDRGQDNEIKCSQTVDCETLE